VLSSFDRPLFDQILIGFKVVYDLRNKPPYVNRVRAGEHDIFFCRFFVELLVHEQLFHFCLGVVKIAFYREHFDIVSFLGRHLSVLHLADLIVGIKYFDPDPVDILKAGHGRFSGIAAGRCHDQRLLVCCFEGRAHELGKQGQGHILERACRTVKQFEHIDISNLFQRCDLLGSKRVLIGVFHAFFQFFFRIVA
jgi:hypothetical protein